MLTRARKRLVAAVGAMAALGGLTMAVAPEAHAAGQTEYVYSASMHKNIPVRIVDGGGGGPKPTLCLLYTSPSPRDS